MKMFMCGLALALLAPSAQAINQEIRALFTPDPSQPQRNVFINQTPNSGYCVTYPQECISNNMFSIRIPVRFGPSSVINPGNGVWVKAPADWRQLTVRNRETGESETVEVRISGLGTDMVLSDTAANLTGASSDQQGHERLWDMPWVYAPPPCLYSGVGSYSPATFRFFWKTPSPGRCTRVAQFRIPYMSFSTLDFAYELRTPNPLGMSSGLYTGSMPYSLGNGADFDIAGLSADDDNLTLDFVLDVQHTLKVDLPPGGNQIILEPLGGWQSWLDQGRAPTRLSRDQTFLISASSRFKMKLECELDLTQGCGIIDRESGYAGQVTVSVTLPNGLTDSSGQPVRRLLLSRDDSVTFQPGHYVDRRPGTLHFEVPEPETAFFIRNSKGRPYKGNITVIWDSEV